MLIWSQIGRKVAEIAKIPCIFPDDQGICGREQFASDCVIRHAVPISPFALPAITKKRAFAGQY